MTFNIIFKGMALVLAIVILGGFVRNYQNKMAGLDGLAKEGFQDTNHVTGAEEDQDQVTPANVDYPASSHKGPGECFPRDRLTSQDLLPHDAANSKFSQVNPAGQGDVDGRNFLQSTYHQGLNTVGTSLRNANKQLRSEPPNPTVAVSIWNKSTIDSDLHRRPLE
jgi:hypothetical protein